MPALVELEHGRVVDDFARLAVDDFVQVHGLGEAAPDVEKLQAERQARVAPQARDRLRKRMRLILVVARASPWPAGSTSLEG